MVLYSTVDARYGKADIEIQVSSECVSLEIRNKYNIVALNLSSDDLTELVALLQEAKLELEQTL